jgi:peptidoglycan pentaglycine glycine transferase (the first glycine)
LVFFELFMHFLQSIGWEQLQKSIGHTTWRTQDILVIRYDLPLGKNYLYVGGAPFDAQVLEEIKKIAKQERAMFLKWEPMVLDVGAVKALEMAGFRPSFRAVQPQRTILIDLAKSEEELLGGIYPARDRAPEAPVSSHGMHPKTRYNIGLAKRRGMVVRSSAEPARRDMDTFIRILQDTAKRDGFHIHPSAYYEKLAALPSCEFFMAEHNGKMVAAALMLFWENTAVYLHGASDYAARNLMAPYMLHWEIIREAKKRGCAQYDLWGIDVKRWPGVTRFKRGFGGEEMQYIGSWDFLFSSIFYTAYYLWNKRHFL